MTSKLPGRRLYEHNIGMSTLTKHNGPFQLIFYESYYCKTDALHHEKFLKSGVGNKLVRLIIDNY